MKYYLQWTTVVPLTVVAHANTGKLSRNFGITHSQIFPKFASTLHRYISVRVCLYAYPQYIKVLKHIAYK